MNISEFAFSLLLIFFPGIICAYTVDMFTNHRERTQFQFVINAFLLGFGSYLLYAIAVYLIAPEKIGSINFIYALSAEKLKISLKEILYVGVVSVLLAIVLIVINTNKLHFRLAQKLQITKKFGEQDVWEFLMNSADTEWVTVRDNENNIMYDGSVKAFSDNSKEAELLLENVSVYKNDSGKHLYDIDVQYLSLSRGKISIEIRSIKQG